MSISNIDLLSYLETFIKTTEHIKFINKCAGHLNPDYVVHNRLKDCLENICSRWNISVPTLLIQQHICAAEYRYDLETIIIDPEKVRYTFLDTIVNCIKGFSFLHSRNINDVLVFVLAHEARHHYQKQMNILTYNGLVPMWYNQPYNPYTKSTEEYNKLPWEQDANNFAKSYFFEVCGKKECTMANSK